jgi:hypothetical protein
LSSIIGRIVVFAGAYWATHVAQMYAEHKINDDRLAKWEWNLPGEERLLTSTEDTFARNVEATLMLTVEKRRQNGGSELEYDQGKNGAKEIAKVYARSVFANARAGRLSDLFTGWASNSLGG